MKIEQADRLTRQARGLVNTSVDDCRNSLNFVSDCAVLREGLRLSEEFGHVTRAKLFKSRIRKLEKEALG